MINKTAAIIAAAGAGNRLGADLPKALVKLVDKTLVEHAVANLAPIAQLIIVTSPAGYVDEYKKILGDSVEVIAGGVLRSDSIRLALSKIPNQYEFVLVHDAARALASTTLAATVIAQLINGEQAVIPALDVIDTIKEVDSKGFVRNTPNRSSLKAVQTPQGFTRSVLERAHAASSDATDDAALVEAIGVAVKVIAGEERALKITTKSDLATATAFLLPNKDKQIRVGIGVDAHAFGSDQSNKLSLAGLIVTLGIIYGDIGTSPLYVMKAIIGSGSVINEMVILGGVSLIFWTLTLQTTIKYVIITLRADNKGEGGIFSLYALVRGSKNPWLVFPAMLGGATLLADGIITPPISVSSAIEGLTKIQPELPLIPIVLVIILSLFIIQRFGTNFVGKFFGPMMFVWFSMLAILGVSQMRYAPEIFKDSFGWKGGGSFGRWICGENTNMCV